MKSIAIIEPGRITYPTDVFKEYNLYLIREYEKFNILGNTSLEIDGLKTLLETNTSNDSLKCLSVMDWEENLDHYYSILNMFLLRHKKPILKTKFQFLRMEKIKRLNNLK